MKCCLCGKEIKDMGHNPWPLREKVHDRCCDECNTEKVIPARLASFRYSSANKESKRYGSE